MNELLQCVTSSAHWPPTLHNIISTTDRNVRGSQKLNFSPKFVSVAMVNSKKNRNQIGRLWGSNSGPQNASPEGYYGIWANVHLVYLFTSPLYVARKSSDPTSRDWCSVSFSYSLNYSILLKKFYPTTQEIMNTLLKKFEGPYA